MRVFLLVFFSIGWALPCISSDIEGRIKGDQFTWISAITTNGGLAPAIWDVPINLPAAEKIVPGGPASIAAVMVKLKLSAVGSNATVSVPVSISGMSYQLSSNVAPVADTTGGITTLSGVSATVMGEGTGNKIVTLSSLSSPFTHYRPILNVDTDAWLAEFKDKEPGIYRGGFNYNFLYDYYRNGVRIRNILQSSLIITVDYNPAQLSTISVFGDGIILPKYYGYPERLVGGTTDYAITAKGVFPNGVYITLKNSPNVGARYQLLPGKTASGKGIDYSVRCTTGCNANATQIITDGIPINKRLTMRSSNTNNTSANSTITVSFSNIKLDDLVTDTYLGKFVLIFEAGM